MTAPEEVRNAARRAYIDHEGYGNREGHNAAADVAFAAGRAAAAADIQWRVDKLPFNASRHYLEGMADAVEIAKDGLDDAEASC